ncbi:MAG: hypothetical protein H0W24_01535 [Lysobacter sp.]|nr:hypothetical protein [Lysobacter sp.]
MSRNLILPAICATALGLAALSALLAGPVVPPAVAEGQQASRSALAQVARFTRPDETLLVGGQPSAEDWAALKRAGVRTVVNLRPDSELPGRDEAAEVAAAGLYYRHMPIASRDDITIGNAQALWRLLDDADAGVALHCASGNRVGALLALGAAQRGMDTEAAIAFGRAAGLGSAEARVRGLLEDRAGR